jgi:hypothetical protein
MFEMLMNALPALSMLVDFQVPSRALVNTNFYLFKTLVTRPKCLYLIGTAIGKGELRFGTLVDMRGMTALYVDRVYDYVT